MNLNKAFVLGNLTKDPERRSLPSGDPVTSFSVATNRFYTSNGEKKEEAELLEKNTPKKIAKTWKFLDI